MQEEVKNEEFSQPEQRMRCVIPKRKRRRAAVNVARVDIMTIL